MSDEDDICRAHPDRGEIPCPRCGYVCQQRPSWADFNVTFALRGTRYRIISIGSTNRHAPRGLHFEDTILCEQVGSDPWSFPSLPTDKHTFKASLDDLFSKPRFRPNELADAYMIEPPSR